MTDPASFGLWLRRERERRAITLRAIADRTKIGAGLLEALERGDVSRWPGGIYRRSFIRGYADAVGLDADLVLANFERLFGSAAAEAEPAKPAAPAAVPPLTEGQPELRLQLGAPRPRPGADHWKRAGLFVLLVLGTGVSGYVAAGWVGFWCAAAVAAVVHHLRELLAPAMHAPRPQPEAADADARPLATVVSFSEEQTRTTTRRARAKKVAAALSVLAAPAASIQRRRAARS